MPTKLMNSNKFNYLNKLEEVEEGIGWVDEFSPSKWNLEYNPIIPQAKKKFQVLIHLRLFVFSVAKKYVNSYSINNGRELELMKWKCGDGCYINVPLKAKNKLFKYYKSSLGASYEGNIKQNFAKICSRYYKIIHYLTKLNIFHEQRKNIIEYIFGEEYYSSFILNFIRNNNERAKKVYNYYLRMNPKETMEFGNIFLNNLNKNTKKWRHYALRTFEPFRGMSYEETQFKFKTITKRSLGDEFMGAINPKAIIKKKLKEQAINPIGVGAVGAGLEYFNNNYESKKQVKFKDEREAIEFKHNKAKRAEFIYRMFKKYKNVLNKQVELCDWSCSTEGQGTIEHFQKQIYKGIYVFRNKTLCFHCGIKNPQYMFNNVYNPNAVDKTIQIIERSKKEFKITKFKNKEEEKQYKNIRGNTIVITIPRSNMEAFNNIVWKKNNVGEPIINYYWGNGRAFRNSLKAKKLNRVYNTKV